MSLGGCLFGRYLLLHHRGFLLILGHLDEEHLRRRRLLLEHRLQLSELHLHVLHNLICLVQLEQTVQQTIPGRAELIALLRQQRRVQVDEVQVTLRGGVEFAPELLVEAIGGLRDGDVNVDAHGGDVLSHLLRAELHLGQKPRRH